MDWVTIVVYLLLIVFGWFSVCGASYDYGDRDFLDFSTRAGKQFVWIICSFGLGFVLLMLDDSLYDMFSYLIYIGLMLLLIVTIFIAPDTCRCHSEIFRHCQHAHRPVDVLEHGLWHDAGRSTQRFGRDADHAQHWPQHGLDAEGLCQTGKRNILC